MLFTSDLHAGERRSVRESLHARKGGRIDRKLWSRKRVEATVTVTRTPHGVNAAQAHRMRAQRLIRIKLFFFKDDSLGLEHHDDLVVRDGRL